MGNIIQLDAINRLQHMIFGIVNITESDMEPLMLSWRLIIDDDNRRGVLAGTDKDGLPMRPVTYRPVSSKGKKLTQAQKNNPGKRRRGIFAGIGQHPSGTNNNLTSAEYRRLSGPPLAPRGAFSRVITNLVTGYEQMPNGSWSAYGFWNEVVSVRGVAFLKYHFNGIGQKVRDLRGVRPEGVEKARKAAVAWQLGIIRAHKRAS